MSDCLYEVAWQPTDLDPDAGQASRRCLILADAAGVGAQLAERLEALGWRCRLHPASSVAGEDSRALDDLLEQAPLDDVIYLGSLDDVAPGDRAAAAEHAATALLHLAQALARRSTAIRLHVITSAAQPVLADDVVCPSAGRAVGPGPRRRARTSRDGREPH